MKYDLIAEFRDGSTECFEYSPKNWNRYTDNNDVVAIVTARTEETVFERVIAHVCRWQKGDRQMKWEQAYNKDWGYYTEWFDEYDENEMDIICNE